MYCSNCGAENIKGEETCVNCGVSLTANKPPNYTASEINKPNIGINILSLCCIPILGIVMYFVWKESQPIAAKSALIFGLCGLGIVVLWYTITFAFGFLFTV